MSLPGNYKHVAMSSAPSQNQILRAGPPVTFNILKERLKATGSAGSSNTKENQNQSPFVSSPRGHPGFHPQKLGKPASEARAPKPPKPPEKPLMPYMRYSRKVWDQVKAQNLELKLWEIGKIIGQMWRDLPAENKQEFIEDYENEKVEYEKNLKAYYKSPAYLSFISAKAKGKSIQQSGDDRELHDSCIGSSKHDRRIEIQPAEDDEDADDLCSVRHISYARYLRNHQLINEIFSDTVVPDVRSVVTATRMQNFCWKIQSLKAHQKKMESEVRQLVEKFEMTKRKLSEASDAFQEEIRKYCKRAVDEDYFNELVEKEYERLRKERLINNSAGCANNPSDEPKKETACQPVKSLQADSSLNLATESMEQAEYDTKNTCGEDSSSSEIHQPTPSVMSDDSQGSGSNSGTHLPTNVNVNPQMVGGYNPAESPVSQNHMPPPTTAQPIFSSLQYSATPRPQFPYQSTQHYTASQTSHPYYMTPYQYQTQTVSASQPQHFGLSPELQTSLRSENPLESDDSLGSLCPE